MAKHPHSQHLLIGCRTSRRVPGLPKPSDEQNPTSGGKDVTGEIGKRSCAWQSSKGHFSPAFTLWSGGSRFTSVILPLKGNRNLQKHHKDLCSWTDKTQQNACTHKYSSCVPKKVTYFQLPSKMKVISKLKCQAKTKQLIDVSCRFGRVSAQ